MKLGIIVYSNDPETIINAFSLATHALKQGDKVSMSLLGEGVEIETLSKEEGHGQQVVKIEAEMRSFIDAGGMLSASGKCLKDRGIALPKLCTLSSVEDMYEMVKGSDKVVTF